MSKFTLLSVLFTFLWSSTFAQTDSVQQVINKEVWLPFIETYTNLDAEGFMAIHTEDVIRIIRDDKNIRVGEEYAISQRESSKRSKANKATRNIQFSFIDRFAKGDIAVESGYYKVKWKSGDQEGISYGAFEVILKKVDGHWKIFIDSDTSQNNTLTEADFQKGAVLK